MMVTKSKIYSGEAKTYIVGRDQLHKDHAYHQLCNIELSYLYIEKDILHGCDVIIFIDDNMESRILKNRYGNKQ